MKNAALENLAHFNALQISKNTTCALCGQEQLPTHYYFIKNRFLSISNIFLKSLLFSLFNFFQRFMV